MSGARESFGALAAYRTVAAIDAAPEELMKMGIEAAQRFLAQAEAGIAATDRPRKARALSSAARIVEFMLGLSGSEPGPLSDRLDRLYRFALTAILRGNAADDAEAVAAARVAVDEIAAEWRRLFPDMVGVVAE
jgi:flagellar biosynthetic protein FliS